MNKDFKSLTEAEYRAYPAESYSSIKHLLESPQAFLYYKNNPFQGSDSTLLGTAIHHYIQGNRHLVAFNHIPRTSKERKLEYIEFEKNFREVAGEEGILVPASFEDKINAVMTSFNENKQAVKLIEGATIEEQFLFYINDIKLKGKIDALQYDKVIEIKTSSMATTAQEFRREAYDRNYDLQTAIYLHASGCKQHYFIVANTTAPFKVCVYKSSNDFIESGYEKVGIVTDRYKRHILGTEVFDNDITEEI